MSMKKSTSASKRPFVLLGSTVQLSDLRYATAFDAPDPVAAVRFPQGRTILLVNGMELGRARNQARGCEVHSADTLGLPAEAKRGESALLAEFLRAEGVSEVEADEWFPLGAVAALEQRGIRTVLATESPWARPRLVKTAAELRAIRASQAAARAAERALGTAIRTADVRSDGVLMRDGRPFTSERALALVRDVLLSKGTMDFEGSIVAGGAQAADPHEAGHGPLRAGEWIVCDIFPRSLRTGYWGDMTRTFAHGRVDAAKRKLYDTVREAQKRALAMIRPGVTGAAVHDEVVRFFRDRGYETGVGKDGRAYGYFHGTGHGVGLDIHEEPRLSLRGGILEPGMVVTVEPGLYYPAIGGVRWEDTVVVTETGCKIL